MTKLETGRISAIQFMFAVACFIQSSSLLTAFFSQTVRQDAWVVVLLGLPVCLPIIGLLVWLTNRFEGMNLFEINDIVFGKIAGKAVSICYLWFFLTLTALNLRDVGDFVEIAIMRKTPKVVIVLLFAFVCAWAVRFGIEVVTRYSALFVTVDLLILAVTILLTLNLIDLKNFLPVFSQPPMRYLQGVHTIITIPFGEMVAFMMLVSFVNFPKKKIKKYFFVGYIIGDLSLLAVVFRDTAVLGKAAALFALPPFETLRMATLTENISRMEILFAVVLIILLFFKVSLLYYVTVLAVSQLLRMPSFRPLILTVGAVVVTYAYNLYPSTVAHAASGKETTPFIWLFFEFMLPLLTMAVALLRKLPQRKEAA